MVVHSFMREAGAKGVKTGENSFSGHGSSVPIREEMLRLMEEFRK
jgi:hypothetical protein